MNNGIKPTKEYNDDGGFDLYTPERFSVPSQEKVLLKIKVLIPIGWTALIRPRSSTYRQGLEVNGTIDRYTGEIFLTIKNSKAHRGPIVFKKGDRIAQLIPTWTGAGFNLKILHDLTENQIDSPTHGTPISYLRTLVELLSACNQMKVVDKLPKTDRSERGGGSSGR